MIEPRWICEVATIIWSLVEGGANRENHSRASSRLKFCFQLAMKYCIFIRRCVDMIY